MTAAGDLANRLAPRAETTPTPQILFGVVTQASPLLVRVGSALTGTSCNRMNSYTPVLSDYVVVIAQGPIRICMGKVV